MRFQSILKLGVTAALALAVFASPVRALAQGGDTILKPADTQKLLPASVYLQGPVRPHPIEKLHGCKVR